MRTESLDYFGLIPTEYLAAGHGLVARDQLPVVPNQPLGAEVDLRAGVGGGAIEHRPLAGDGRKGYLDYMGLHGNGRGQVVVPEQGGWGTWVTGAGVPG